jgi:hypothetical protein
MVDPIEGLNPEVHPVAGRTPIRFLAHSLPQRWPQKNTGSLYEPKTLSIAYRISCKVQ